MAKKTREVVVLEGFGIIELTRGFRARVDERHAVWASQWNWRLHAQGSALRRGPKPQQVAYYLHREILKLEGHTLEGQDVVALDGNYLNCVVGNLQVCDSHHTFTALKGIEPREGYIATSDGAEYPIDPEDFSWAAERSWHLNSDGYLCSSKSRTRADVRLHCEIMRRHGTQLAGMEVDHVNGNRTDNRKSNLRVVPRQHNALNRGLRSDNTSGFKGVNFHKKSGKWNARVQKFGDRTTLGPFDTAEEASAAYEKAAEALFGDFKRKKDDY